MKCVFLVFFSDCRLAQLVGSWEHNMLCLEVYSALAEETTVHVLLDG